MARSDFWFSFPFRVRYAEIDAQGIVFNGVYLTYFDTAITEYLREMNYDFEKQIEDTNTDFHVVKVVVEFAGPVRFDDEIDVCVRTGRIGNSSVTFTIEIFPKGKDKVLTKGEVIWVNAIRGEHQSAPVPEGLIQKIREHEPSV